MAANFPFTILDVASLLRLNIRRRGGSRVVYADCPVCGDRRGKLGLYPELDTWHCWHCGEHGGMLALYGKAHHVDNATAYREICDALMTGESGPAYIPGERKTEEAPETPQSKRAGPQEIHRTLTALLAMLPLTPAHREHLRSVRGLMDGQIAQFGFKSTPPPYRCRAITAQLIRQGCTVQGVPGFYQDSAGRWTVKFYRRTSGILIPQRGVDGLLCGLQIRLDHPIKDKDDPPEKTGIKYLPLTSTGKPMGVTSGNPIHFVGDPCSRVVYVTEGALKADIAHALCGRTFAATVGVCNSNGLEELFAFLRRNGTQEIIEAEDMDKYSNPQVNRGASKVCQLAVKNGLQCRRLVWNPNHKGIDDWLLALKRKEKTHEEVQKMSTEKFETQRYRVYQLDLPGIKAHPFAFRSIDVMRSAGYLQPPAESYRLVYDGELDHSEGEQDCAVLERIFARCNDNLPEGYRGRSLSMSDVVELHGEDDRRFFYCDTVGFIPVEFDAAQAAPTEESDGNG